MKKALTIGVLGLYTAGMTWTYLLVFSALVGPNPWG